MMIKTNTPNKWLILCLSGLTNALVVAAPGMSMSVLFKEISTELNLSLVQVGLIWGLSALPAIFTGLLAGMAGDRYGPRRIILLGSIIIGLAGACRGLANSFFTLTLSAISVGLFTPMVIMNTVKTCGIWFPSQQLGLANGVLSMGMASGFLVGSFFSATYLSPLLGGWRNVFYFYGALAALISIPWIFTPNSPEAVRKPQTDNAVTSMRESVLHVSRLKNIWLLGMVIMGISGCVQGTLGYLPLYLRNLGWQPIYADGALSTFHTVSMICVLPIALWSDKLGSRKKLLITMAALLMSGIGLLSIVDGVIVWFAVSMAGFVRDGFMAIFMTMIVETDGVGPLFTGTATGFVMIFSGIGNLFAPPLGNKLEQIKPGIPFIFWSCLAMISIAFLTMTKERKPAES
jgi:MFS family permease